MCAKLKAVRQQQMVKFLNTVVSGVVAVQSAQHGFYLSQGLVNLVKGEVYIQIFYFIMNLSTKYCCRYVCMDYALSSALGMEALLQ